MICTSIRLRASTPISRGFALPRPRSAGFGYSMHDLTRAHADPRCLRSIGFPTAPAVNALASPYTKTPWGVIHNERTDTAPPAYAGFVAFMPVLPVTSWFHALCTSLPGYFAAFAHATIALSVSGSI
jgi:hypothetical protein